MLQIAPMRLMMLLAVAPTMLAAPVAAFPQQLPAGKPGVFAGHNAALSGAKFSAGGKLLVTGSFDHSLKLWDVTTARELRTLTGHQHQVLALDVSRDGTLLVSGVAVSRSTAHRHRGLGREASLHRVAWRRVGMPPVRLGIRRDPSGRLVPRGRAWLPAAMVDHCGSVLA